MAGKGRFITFEGPEGCGKSTQIQRLSARLGTLGIKAVATREPGGTPLGECIRGMLQHDTAGESPCDRAETLLFCASRAQLVRNVVAPALARGEWVLSDRFTDSTVAYQGYGRGLPVDELAAMNEFATGGLHPDVTLVLDITAEEGMRRMAERCAALGEDPDRFEREAVDFHRRMRDGFLALAAADPARCVVIDASGDPDSVEAAIWRVIVERLGPREG